MSDLIYTLIFNNAGEPATGVRAYAHDGVALAPREYKCSQNQADRFQCFVLQNGKIVDVGEKPSEVHRWNIATQSYVLNADKEAELLVDIKSKALQSIANKHASMLAQLSGNATIEERDTWALKLSAAQASVDQGQPNSHAILLFTDEAAADSVSVMTKCDRVVAYNNAYAMLIGIASGIKTRAENAVKAAVNLDDVNSALSQALLEAETAAAQYLKTIGG